MATGAKANIDKKAMKKLTTKNYEKLPEVMQRKREALEREEKAQQRAKQRAYQKELNQRLKDGLKKKKTTQDSARPKEELMA